MKQVCLFLCKLALNDDCQNQLFAPISKYHAILSNSQKLYFTEIEISRFTANPILEVLDALYCTLLLLAYFCSSDVCANKYYKDNCFTNKS